MPEYRAAAARWRQSVSCSSKRFIQDRCSLFQERQNLPPDTGICSVPLQRNICVTLTPFLLYLAAPDPHDPILPPLRQIPVFDPHPLHHTDPAIFFCTIISSTCTAIPVPSIRPVVDFRYRLTCRGNDAPRIEHHACDGIFVGVGIDDGACAEIPYLLSVVSK